jgi:hypothetical protein
MKTRVAWVIAIVDVVLFLAVTLAPSDGGLVETLIYTVGIASFAGMGALLWTRVPANPIGPLLLASGTLLVAAIVVGMYADVGAMQTPPWPNATAARLIADTLFMYPFLIAFVGVPLVFPDGRLPSPRYRVVGGALIVLLSVWTLLGLLFDQETGARIPGLKAIEPLVGVLELVVLISVLVSCGGAVAAVWSRFRHGDTVQRQQVKWLVANVGLAGAILPVSLLTTEVAPDLSNVLSSVAILAMFALPLVIAIAVLRYRLYEIDRIVGRTVAYAIVSGVLALVFVVTNLALQALFAGVTGSSTLITAMSTLVVATLFQPLRGRVQRLVDRRFNRGRVDAERVVGSLAAQVRDQVDLDRLRVAVVASADDAVAPAGAGLWLRGTR